MIEPSRRTAIAAGGAALAAAIVGLHAATSAAGGRAQVVLPSRRSRASATPTPTPTPTPTLAPLADPVPFLTIAALSNPGVMQDFSYVPEIATYFVTQKTAGTAMPYETLIVNRVDASGTTLDAMTLLDGGHGLGIEADVQPDGTYVWVTWQGKSPESLWREHDLVRLRYTPGTWSRGQAVQQLALTVLPVKDDPEAQYRFDWKNDWAVERHYDFNRATETYKRRRISDIRNGVLVPTSSWSGCRCPSTRRRRRGSRRSTTSSTAGWGSRRSAA